MRKEKFNLAILTNKGHLGLKVMLERSLDSLFQYDIINCLEDIKAMPNPTNYDACFVLATGSTIKTHEVAPMIEELILKSPNLVWIHSMLAGVDHIINETLKKSTRITLTNTKGAYDSSIAEFVLLSVLYFAKKMQFLMTEKTQHKFERRLVDHAAGVKVGIIGYGSIGKNAAILLKKSLNAKIYAIRHTPKLAEDDKQIVEYMGGERDIPYVISEVDYVVNVLPKTTKTLGLYNMEMFKKMKSHAVFINIGRGDEVVEEDLIEALKSGVIAGAGLDVFAVEPLPATSPLYEMNNVLFSPHTMFYATDGWDSCIDTFEKELKSFIEGKPFGNVVDLSQEY